MGGGKGETAHRRSSSRPQRVNLESASASRSQHRPVRQGAITREHKPRPERQNAMQTESMIMLHRGSWEAGGQNRVFIRISSNAPRSS